MSNSTTMVSSLSPNAPVFQPRSWRQGSLIQRTPAPQGVQPQEPPKPPYLWSAVSPHTRLVYITDPRVADYEISRLRPGPLGFDLEWKPTYRKNQPQNLVALVQLANEDTILLLHISRMPAFPVHLQDILENPNIVKTGVGIQYDSKKLYFDHHVNMRNCADLSLLARSVDNDRWKGSYKTSIGLAKLCDVYEGLALSKDSIRTSNWELPLDTAQQNYAANDCHVALILYNRFFAMAQSMDTPPRPNYFTFDSFNANFYETFSLPWCLWQPYNPYYDPGPPPPPKPPKPPKPRKEKKVGRTTVFNGESADLVESDDEPTTANMMRSLELTNDEASDEVRGTVETDIQNHFRSEVHSASN